MSDPFLNTRPNVSFLTNYTRMRDSLLDVARSFARGCEHTGLMGTGPIDCRQLARETRATLERMHEQLLQASDTFLDGAILHVRFCEALDTIFSRHGHTQPEVSGARTGKD